MSIDSLQTTVRSIIVQLAHGDYESVVAQSSASRLTASELRDVVRGYGRTLMIPPDTEYQALDAVQVRGAANPTWSVRVPLWTQEEGRSDLTLELTVVLNENQPRFELDDLHVL